MAEFKKCPQCGASLAADAPGGHCPRCLLELAAVLAAESPANGKPGNFIGHYQLLQEIGEGGMGTVWMAEQVEPVRRRVALKLIKLGLDTKQVVARFEAERQALALMDHPNIAKIFDAGATADGRPFFVMELVQGIRITDYCDQEKLDTPARLKLFAQVCQAIQHAHQKGIIHRDIKPSNILITHGDSGPAPKIIDFGIAKAIGGQKLTDKTLLTALEQFIGTPAYMSPEQADLNALDIDARSDVYALGVLLYELLTGKTPFESTVLLSKALDEIRRIIREEDPPRPSTRLSKLTQDELTTTARCRQANPPRLVNLLRGDLDWIVMKTLEKDRTRRYRTASDLADDIGRHLRDETITAQPPGIARKVHKAVRRHKLAFLSLGSVLILATVGALLLRGIWPGQPDDAQLLEDARGCLAHYDEKGNLRKALADLREMNDTGYEAEAFRGWAHWLLFVDGNSGNEAERLEAYNCSSNSVAKNPGFWLSHFVQGLYARNQRDWLTATNELLLAKQLSKDGDGLVLASLAQACWQSGNTNDALKYVDLAKRAGEEVLAEPNTWMTFDRLGDFYQLTGDINTSLTNYQIAIRIAPADPLPHLKLGQAYLVKQQWTNALAELQLSLSLRDTAQSHGTLGSFYLGRKNYDQAAACFREACGLDPENYRYLFSAALCLRYSHRPDASTNSHLYFQQALEKLNDNLAVGGYKAQVDAYRGACLAGLGQAKEAGEELAKARKESGSDAHIQHIIGVGYRFLREDAAAKK